jgi:outer membrane protein assembly factor BamD (BamD/ComL family)
MADALYRYGDRLRAFYYLDELLENYPDSHYFYTALEKQFDIADGYLGGYKRRLLYMPILDAQDEGVEMMYRIQQRSPGSQMAERALLRTADYYYADSQFDLAGDAYAAYARNYARSPVIPKVRLRQAFSSLAQFRGLRYDPSPLIDARAQLVDISHAYPQLAAEENVDSVVDRIDATFARKLDLTADFYKRTHVPRASVYTYRYLVETYPNSPEADHARVQIAKLPAPALAAPAPPAGTGYEPTTRPASEVR